MTEGVASPERLSLRREVTRKALHVTTAVIPIAYRLGMPRETLAIVLAIGSAAALLIEGARRADARFGAAFDRRCGVLLRHRERTTFSAGTMTRSAMAGATITGATCLLVACCAAVLLVSRHAAIAALWCATVGDPAATLAGVTWKAAHPPEPGMEDRKSLIGSFACGAASFIGVWILAGYAPSAALIVASVAAAAERLAGGRFDDNLLVTGAAAATAQILA
jgi:dolichol kinase